VALMISARRISGLRRRRRLGTLAGPDPAARGPRCAAVVAFVIRPCPFGQAPVLASANVSVSVRVRRPAAGQGRAIGQKPAPQHARAATQKEGTSHGQISIRPPGSIEFHHAISIRQLKATVDVHIHYGLEPDDGATGVTRWLVLDVAMPAVLRPLRRLITASFDKENVRIMAAVRHSSRGASGASG